MMHRILYNAPLTTEWVVTMFQLCSPRLLNVTFTTGVTGEGMAAGLVAGTVNAGTGLCVTLGDGTTSVITLGEGTAM